LDNGAVEAQNAPADSKEAAKPAFASGAAPAVDGPAIPGAILATLPTFFHDADAHQKVVRLSNDAELGQFLDGDLDLSRLARIRSLLWMCGRPFNARALHRNLVLNRRVVVTEQADLHLLTYADVLAVKPLPAYLLSEHVWARHLCRDRVRHSAACGLLLSYVWLVRSPTDFRIAEKLALLPAGLTWPHWRRIVGETLARIDADALDQVHVRFTFGELRLGRINTIYRTRFIFSHFVRGYLYGYNRYAPFLQRNVAWILGVSVLFSLVLSAMQVGTGVDPLRSNDMFNRASFGFVVFICVLVMAVLGFVGIIFSFIYLHNMVAAIQHDARERKRRASLARERKEKQV
jgi:hypothetical protein